MKHAFAFVLAATVLASQGWAGTQRPRVVVLTDITNEPDDEESLVRFLVSSSDYDVEAMIATTSTWLRKKVRPDKIQAQVRAYKKVYPNLIKHDPRYPSPDHLLSVTSSHLPVYGMSGVGKGKDSAGSKLLISVIDKPDKRPVRVTVWGGANCLAQALWKVRNTRTGAQLAEFVAKIRVYTISDQDDSGAWMRKEFGKLFYIVTPSDQGHKQYRLATWTGISGERRYKFAAPPRYFAWISNEWLRKNVIEGHGPLGAMYPKWKYIMEGDTPSYLNLIDNGLGGEVRPDYGGWGGRYKLSTPPGQTRPIWTNSPDTLTVDSKSYSLPHATVWRWREAYQNDFAARMDWCVSAKRSDANHHPVAVANGVKGKSVVSITAQNGQTVTLSAAGSADPDGDKVTLRWFQYLEAGSASRVDLRGADTEQVSFIVPSEPGKTLHMILEVKDNGKPNLFSYRRVVVTITKSEK
ncbi:MAG: DUF1593 domain-containing protein [Phycisphaerae bacterium]|jgi:hypothetical protein|nr:DUF1593 domain-containing protein [Phycisphaerae bacterium]MDP7288477.1 DUF1593 domain-containing protein [Phycisphaerae bacterium]